MGAGTNHSEAAQAAHHQARGGSLDKKGADLC